MYKRKVAKVIKSPKMILVFFVKRLSWLIKSDKLYLSLRWYAQTGTVINWSHPERFTEKLQWLKIYNRNPLYTTLVDKIEAKKYVASIIGEQYIIPTISIWDRAEDIDFGKLPSKFVLKCNHDSGTGMCVCRDKTKIDTKAVRDGLSKGLKSNYFIVSREWPYKNVKRQVFAEVLMEQTGYKDLIDYKWYCFGGKVHYCQVIQNRSSNETIDFFDTEWNHLNFIGLIGLSSRVSHAEIRPNKPINLHEMIEIATKLSKDLPFSRIDLYEINKRVYFGEITFFPLSGFGAFDPDEIDFELGKLVRLENI